MDAVSTILCVRYDESQVNCPGKCCASKLCPELRLHAKLVGRELYIGRMVS